MKSLPVFLPSLNSWRTSARDIVGEVFCRGGGYAAYQGSSGFRSDFVVVFVVAAMATRLGKPSEASCCMCGNRPGLWAGENGDVN